MMIFDLLLLVNLVVGLYIWFDTEAVPEWARLFRMRFFKYEEFEAYKRGPLANISGVNYVDFLMYQYGSASGLFGFLIRGLTCSLCFPVWCNLVMMGALYNKLSVLFLGPNILITWVMYFALRKTIKFFQ